MRRIAAASLTAAFVSGVLLTLGGCATEQTATGQQRESAIPWNRPASWEGPGVYGSAINGG
ncbi:MAG: hypothetical protein WA771_16675 [Chthoniobacterales bacterium]